MKEDQAKKKRAQSFFKAPCFSAFNNVELKRVRPRIFQHPVLVFEMKESETKKFSWFKSFLKALCFSAFDDVAQKELGRKSSTLCFLFSK